MKVVHQPLQKVKNIKKVKREESSKEQKRRAVVDDWNEDDAIVKLMRKSR